MRIGIRTFISSWMLLNAKYKDIFFIKHFLISPIFYEWSKFINFGFLIKEDFWYVISIWDFTGLNIYNTFIHIQNFSSI